MDVSKNRGKPQNGWFISWKTLWTNGWFGGKHPYFWFNTHIPYMDPMGFRCLYRLDRVIRSVISTPGIRRTAAFSRSRSQRGGNLRGKGVLGGWGISFLTWPMAKRLKLFGITYLVGKINFKLFFSRVHWLSEILWYRIRNNRSFSCNRNDQCV